MSRRALGWTACDGGWLDGARAVPSPHRDARPAGAAIDLLVDKLDRQLIKHKEKQVEQRRSEGLARMSAED